MSLVREQEERPKAEEEIMSKENEDGGYSGFHHMHKGGLNAHADPIPWKKAPDSGPHSLGKDEGMKPDFGIKPFPNVKPVGS